MKKIAIWNCLKANDVCSGVACMKAFNNKTAAFADYTEHLELVAFARCNGCSSDINLDEGMRKKIERIINAQTDNIHFGVCTQHNGKECPTITRIGEIMQQSGITVVRGCH